jgi:hypothetical protein
LHAYPVDTERYYWWWLVMDLKKWGAAVIAAAGLAVATVPAWQALSPTQGAALIGGGLVFLAGVAWRLWLDSRDLREAKDLLATATKDAVERFSGITRDAHHVLTAMGVELMRGEIAWGMGSGRQSSPDQATMQALRRITVSIRQVMGDEAAKEIHTNADPNAADGIFAVPKSGDGHDG